MVLIGSLFRRLAPGDADAARIGRGPRALHVDADARAPRRLRRRPGRLPVRLRRLPRRQPGRAVRPGRGARHASRSPRAPRTRWQYGLIPSSHSAIEAQFGLAAGLGVDRRGDLGEGGQPHAASPPFRLDGQRGGEAGRRKAPRRAAPVAAEPVADRLVRLPGRARRPSTGWTRPSCSAGASTSSGWPAATATWPAPPTPSPCSRRRSCSPGCATGPGPRRTTSRTRRSPASRRTSCRAGATCAGSARSCSAATGSARSATTRCRRWPATCYDRLAPLGLDLEKRTVQRALLDLDADPELAPCSRPAVDAAPPAARTARSGRSWASGGWASGPIQESWDLALGRHQRALIELGYEGVTVEQVLEQRLRRARVRPAGDRRASRWRPSRTPSLYLRSRRLADELGARAVELLAAERTVDDAPEVLRRIRRLLAHYRATEPALPAWCEAFVTDRLRALLHPAADRVRRRGRPASGRSAAMLGFLFSMESLALSLGCDRAQLELAVRAVAPGGARQGGAAVGGPAPARPAAAGRAAGALRRAAGQPAGGAGVPAVPQRLRAGAGAGAGAGAVRGRGDVQRVRPAARPGPAALAADADHHPAASRRRSWCRCWSARPAARSPATLPALDAWVPPWLAAAGARAAGACRRRRRGRWPTLLAAHPAASTRWPRCSAATAAGRHRRRRRPGRRSRRWWPRIRTPSRRSRHCSAAGDRGRRGRPCRRGDAGPVCDGLPCAAGCGTGHGSAWPIRADGDAGGPPPSPSGCPPGRVVTAA